MSHKHDSSAGGGYDLDETIERQMGTTGLTGVMQTLEQHKAADDVVAAATGPEDEEPGETTVVLPPDALA